MKTRRLPFLLAALSLSAARAHALDGYIITIATNVMKGDLVGFTLNPMDSGLPDNTAHNVAFVNLPTGVTVTPNNTASGVPIAGATTFSLSVGASATPGLFTLQAENRPFSGITGSVQVRIEKTVDHFDIILPSPSFTGTAGTPFTVELIAKDDTGAVVSGYHDNIQISASTGLVTVNGFGVTAPGADFVAGRSTVSVQMFGTDPVSRNNVLQAQATVNYPGQPASFLASGSTIVGIDPGAYAKIVLLFPGESLTPGSILTKKTGTATAATASVPVNNVLLYLVDTYANPILTNPGGVTISYQSLSHPTPPNADTVPGPRSVVGNVDLMNGQFSFQIANVNHTVQATDVTLGYTDQTTLLVNSGAANTIVISTVTSPRLATDLFTLTARVTDGTPAGNTVTSYNGSATVSINDCNGTGIPNTPNSLDTNTTVAGAQNTITFAGGVFGAPIQVFKEFLGACLQISDGLGNIGVTNSFQNDHGPFNHLHIVLPGQTFTPGAYPGNNPSQPPNPQTAGNLVSVDVYAVDAAWNKTPVSAGQTVVVDAANGGFVDLTAGSPTMPASGGPATTTGIRLRTAYPSTSQQLIANMGAATGTSDVFTVNPRPYTQVVFVSPGETLRPGISSGVEPDGKTGLPSSQTVSAVFPISVYLTDDYFNPIINPPLSGGLWPQLTFSLPTPTGGIVNFPFTNPFPMTGGIFLNQMTLGTLGANVVRVTDNSPTPKVVNQTIDVVPGAVDRFVVTPNPASVTADPIPIQTAGAAFNLTFKAFDNLNNLATNFGGDVTLQLWENGAPLAYGGVISPSTVTFVANPVTGGVVTTPITITYAGSALGNGPDQLQVRAFISTPTVKEGFSAFFSVKELLTWSGVVTTLPGETRRPGLGLSALKTGTPTPVTAGVTLPVTVTAVDVYGNRLDQAAVADLSIPTPSIFSSLPVQVTLTQGQGTGFLRVYTAGSVVVQSSVAANGFSNSSTVAVSRGSYSATTGKLLLLAPGETVITGSPSSPGKNSVGISTIQANTATAFTLLACDQFYNVDTTFSGNSISLSSNDGAINVANIPVNSGTATVSNVFLKGNLPNPSTVRVTATDQSNIAKTSYADVPVTPGAAYEITVPTGALAGQDFSMTVTLRDPNTGLPVPTNNSITLQAITSTGSAAAVSLGVTLVNLNNGSVTFNQNYSYVETIKIRVTDSFNRLAESGNIVIRPNGLKYVVTLPALPKTTDDVFPVTVGLYDTVQDALPIRDSSYQHTFSVGVLSGGLPAAGSAPVTAATLTGGVATFNFSYTKVEHIVVTASGSVAGFTGITGLDDMDITPGAYVKLQIVAPGEVEQPGVPSLTGKDSSGIVSQPARESFVIKVNAVDRYWNVVTGLSTPLTPTITLTASDGSIGSTAHPAQGFLNGQALFTGIQLNTPPQVTVTARDTSSNSLFPQAVVIPLTGRLYSATATSNTPPDFFSGPPSTFNVDVALFRFDGVSTGSLVTGFTGQVTVQPLSTSLEPLSTADVVILSPPLPNPSQANVFTMHPSGLITLTVGYRVARDVIFKFVDEDGWQGFSAPLHFVPRDVTYAVTVPTQTRVGPPDSFSMTLTPRDVDTGTTALNFASTVTLTAISASGGLPGTGTLQVSGAVVSGGAVTFPQAYSQAGVFRLRVSDGVLSPVESAPINFLPGPLAGLSSNLPATLEAGATQQIDVTLLDAFANPIPNLPVSFRLSDPSFGTLSTALAVSDVAGQASTLFVTNDRKSGAGNFTATSDVYSVSQGFRLLGPPTTSLAVGGTGRVLDKGLALKETNSISLSAAVETGMTLSGIFYSIDGGPFLTYTAPFPIPGVGVHTLRYYSVSQAVLTHVESTHTVAGVYVSADTRAEEGLVNYPNPFQAGRDVTFLEYRLANPSNVRLTIYDMMGHVIDESEVFIGQAGGQAGLNRLSWDGRNSNGTVVANGGYVAVLELKDEGRTLKRKIAVRK